MILNKLKIINMYIKQGLNFVMYEMFIETLKYVQLVSHFRIFYLNDPVYVAV